MTEKPLFLVTGVGHSGTKYMSALFTELGFECGHERWHNLKPYAGMGTPDSSGLAVPNLHRVGDIPVVHLVRDPLLVLRSVMRSRTLGPRKEIQPYNRFIARHLRQDLRAPVLDRMIHFVAEWDRPVEKHPRRMLMRVDRAGPRVVARVVKHATGREVDPSRTAAAMDRLGRAVHSRDKDRRDLDERITWDLVLTRPHGQRLADRAARYGYL